MMTAPNQPHALLYLWESRTLYIGELFELPSIRTAAAVLIFGLEKPFFIQELTSGASGVETRSALVSAGAKVHVDSRGQIMAAVFLDPFGRDFRSLKPQMKKRLADTWVDSGDEDRQLKVLQRIYHDIVAMQTTYDFLLKDILPSKTPRDDSNEVDARLLQVVACIKDDPASNESNQVLASKVGMSESQLQRQFKQVIGIPLRRYRLWHRLFVTAGYMALGNNITDAALAAGFSDSSHFSRTFRNMLGMTPSFVFQRHSRILINPESRSG